MESLRYSGNLQGVRGVEGGMTKILVLALTALLAAGCGSEATDDREPTERAPLPDGLLVEIERPGTLPVAIYGDGRVFTSAPQIAIYPPPALPAFNVAKIPPQQARRIADHLTRLGEADAAAVDAVLADLPVSSGDELYEPTALAVIAGNPAEPEEGIEPEMRDWPLDDLVSGCSAVRGDDLSRVLKAASTANQLTRWRSGNEVFGVTFRPLLPHEHGCEDVRS
jgi:hypothetical protein